VAWSRPDERTFALGLVGDGIGRSLTPAMQEREGRAQGLSVTYRTIDLAELGLGVDDLPEVLTWARRFGLDGLNITHPCKQAVLPLLDDVAPAAAGIGAVNTVVLREGRLVGHNTDASGFVAGLRAALPEALSDRVVMLGAGGAGSAIGYAVLEAGLPHLTVVDVEAGRRDGLVARLAERFGADRVTGAAAPQEALSAAGGLVNATPIGMDSHPGLPLDPDLVRPDLWVADIIYFPIDTALLRLARERECRVVDGGGMAVHQAVGAFELFTGRPADAERIRAHFGALLAARDAALTS
jgi:shikimate dehydrogenase